MSPAIAPDAVDTSRAESLHKEAGGRQGDRVRHPPDPSGSRRTYGPESIGRAELDMESPATSAAASKDDLTARPSHTAASGNPGKERYRTR
jgi:hypothetical protein